VSLGIEDLAVGHWTDPVGLTGCTVVIPPPGNRAAASVRGGGPGTRETDLLQPQAHVEGVSAVLLTGGSAFGLAAAQGVVDWCERRGLGYGRFGRPIPIVPAAVLFARARPRARPPAWPPPPPTAPRATSAPAWAPPWARRPGPTT
jgi:L-aminopeptidase/D-esterase-like protein